LVGDEVDIDFDGDGAEVGDDFFEVGDGGFSEGLGLGVVVSCGGDAVFDGFQAVVELGELGDDAGDGVVFSCSPNNLFLLKSFLICSQRCFSSSVRRFSISLNLRRLASAPVVRVWDSFS